MGQADVRVAVASLQQQIQNILAQYMTSTNMLDIADIIKTAINEHESDASGDGPEQASSGLITDITTAMNDIASIAPYSRSAKPLSLVTFRCMLQDTGYPMEVYLPGQSPSEGQEVDWSKLKERWVGWGVEVPGESHWVGQSDSLNNGISNLTMNGEPHPAQLQAKYPLPEQKADYLGALIKVYDDVSFRPASTHTFVGLLSSAPLPSPIAASADGSEEQTLVPTIHVLRGPLSPTESTPIEDVDSIRSSLLQYLSASLSIDTLSAEYILLALLASPSVRPPALPPLGTLSVNLIGSCPHLSSILRNLMPALVDLPLTLPTLHSVPFNPSSTNTSSDSSSLSSGLLQLSEGTVLLVDETAMGDGGTLQEKAVRNLQALTETIAEQKVRYEYPYMDGLKMEACIRTIVLSEGKSLVPVDVHLPIKSASGQSSSQNLSAFRIYLQHYGSMSHARKLVIPEITAARIQEDFVVYRRQQGVGGDAEEVLKRRMKIARLLAVSYRDAELTEERWKRVVGMDEEAQKRMLERKTK